MTSKSDRCCCDDDYPGKHGVRGQWFGQSRPDSTQSGADAHAVDPLRNAALRSATSGSRPPVRSPQQGRMPSVRPSPQYQRANSSPKEKP